MMAASWDDYLVDTMDDLLAVHWESWKVGWKVACLVSKTVAHLVSTTADCLACKTAASKELMMAVAMVWQMAD